MTAAWSTSTDSAVVPAGAVARGTVRLPGSKSVTHRAFALALVARRELVVERPLLADDTELALAALATLGCEVERRPAAVAIRPADHDPAGGAIDCGNAGTLLRFLVAITATIPGRWRLDGVARLRERPIGPLAAARQQVDRRSPHAEPDLDFVRAARDAASRLYVAKGFAGHSLRFDA